MVIEDTIQESEASQLTPLRVKLTEIIPKDEENDYEPEKRTFELRDYRNFEFIDLDEDREYTLTLTVGTSRYIYYQLNT